MMRMSYTAMILTIIPYRPVRSGPSPQPSPLSGARESRPPRRACGERVGVRGRCSFALDRLADRRQLFLHLHRAVRTHAVRELDAARLRHIAFDRLPVVLIVANPPAIRAD